jgi:hypothetical protein
MVKDKKINIHKLIKKHKKEISGFTNKRWSIAVFLLMAVFAYGTQAFFDAKFNPDTAQANMMQSGSELKEAFKINNAYKIIASDSANLHYINPGEENAQVFAFVVEANTETLVLKGLQLKLVGNVDSRELLEARLLEGDEVIARSKVREGVVSFSKFTSILQPESSKEYKVVLDITGDVKSGSRFKFQIENPYALRLYINDEVDYSLGDYPIDGGYVSVVGFRK